MSNKAKISLDGRTTSMSRDEKAHNVKKRPERIPMRHLSQLAYPIPTGYQGYWEIDQPGRLPAREAAGWEYVLDELGNKIKRVCPNGDTLYLMQSLIEYVQEDEAIRQSDNDRIMNQIQQGLGSGQYAANGQQIPVQERKARF